MSYARLTTRAYRIIHKDAYEKEYYKSDEYLLEPRVNARNVCYLK